MIKRLFKRMIILVGLMVIIVSSCSIAFASNLKKADNGVSLYVDYGDGYEYLTKLYFGKSVTEQSVIIEHPIKAIRVVRGECYDLNLDRLTLNGICPADYERKLSATDNDLIEIEDIIDFELEGQGELIVAARAPETVQGEEYSIKFPKYNIGAFKPSSYFYQYELDSNNEIFSDSDELQIPSKDSFFVSEMCYPDSGHPDAPIDFYVANDDDMLYVFFEAFVDNTLDNGKDFAGIHIKCGDTVKTYKVYTTEENKYGRWWFEYTNSSNIYDWQHMNYLIKIPLVEIENDDTIEIAFEYYGTVSAQELLERLGVGEVYYITQEMLDYDIAHANDYEWSSRYYDDECIRILPEPGETSNANGGDTEEGDWWLTNTGTEQKPEYTLYLNGVTLHNSRRYWSEAIIAPYGSLTICLMDGTTNTIIASKESGIDYGIDAQASMDIDIMGNGTLNVVAKSIALIGYGNLTISDDAVVNAVADQSTYDEAVYFAKDITLDNGTLRAIHSRAESEYEVNSFGLVCRGKITLENNSLLEVSSSEGINNYGLAIKSLGKLNYDEEIAVVKEGDDSDSAEEVEELTRVSDYPYYSLEFGSKPYVLINQNEEEAGPTVTHKVTFDSNGGSEVASQNVNDGAKAIKPSNPTKRGYKFKGWQKDGNTFDFSTAITEDIELKAIWKKKSSSGSSVPSSYKVTTKARNASVSPESPNVKRNSSQEFRFKANAGYKITYVLLDGKSIGVLDSYVIDKVTANHTIEVKTAKAEKTVIEENENNETNPVEINVPIVEEENNINNEISLDNFTDVSKTDSFYGDVEYAVGNKLFSGMTETEFGPNIKITRGMLVTVLYKFANGKEIGLSDFEDVDKEEYYSAPIAWATKNGFVSGIGDNKFAPDANVTRQDLATILYKYVKSQGKGFTGMWTFLLDAVDRDEIEEYAYEPVCWFVMNNVYSTDKNNKINPTNEVTRIETIQIFRKISDLLK